MADNESSNWQEAAVKLGLVLAVVGALVGFGREGTGAAALTGAVAGFVLGYAIVRAIVAAILLAVAALALFLATNTIKRTVPVFIPTSTPTFAIAPDIPVPIATPTASATPGADAVQGLPIWFINECPQEVRLFIRWNDIKNGWMTNGPWIVPGDRKMFLQVGDNVSIRSTSPDIYFYAYVAGDDDEWPGDIPVIFNGKTLPMRKANVTTAGTISYDFGVNCRDL